MYTILFEKSALSSADWSNALLVTAAEQKPIRIRASRLGSNVALVIDTSAAAETPTLTSIPGRGPQGTIDVTEDMRAKVALLVERCGSQRELARRLKTNQNKISRILAGAPQKINYATQQLLEQQEL